MIKVYPVSLYRCVSGCPHCWNFWGHLKRRQVITQMRKISDLGVLGLFFLGGGGGGGSGGGFLSQ